MEVILKNKNADERSLIPVLSLLGVALLTLIFIAGIALGVQFNSSNSLSSDSISSWVSALATVSISVLTFFLAKETWNLRLSQLEQLNQLRRESIRPNVVVNVSPSVADAAFLDISVQNIGKGVAHDLTFSFDFNEPTSKSLEDIFYKFSIFKNGCSSFGVGQILKSYFLSFSDLEEKIGRDKIFSLKVSITIFYSDSEGYKYENKMTIDFSDFDGIQILEGSIDPIYSIFQEVKKIRKDFESIIGITIGGKRIKIDSFNSEDRNKEQERIKNSITRDKPKD